jgi:NADH-quinone oxidoreductase subunit M
MDDVGGIWNRLPVLAFFFILASLGSAALPGLNGFVGEFPILVGMFAESPKAAVLGATGMILGACYLFWMLRKVVFGPLHEPPAHHPIDHAGAEAQAQVHHGSIRPIGWHEIAGLSPLMVMIVLIGILPGPFLDRIRPSVTVIDGNLQAQRAAKRLAPEPVANQGRGSISAPRGGAGTQKGAATKKSGADQKGASAQRKRSGP